MTPYLLDVNVLLALTWPSHVHHTAAQRWFAANRKNGFRTCPLTQTAFVRIASNPRFSPDAVSPSAALEVLRLITAMPEHDFWPDDLNLEEAIEDGTMLVGHRQITDAYLIGLARRQSGIVATFDRGMLAVATEANQVELLTG